MNQAIRDIEKALGEIYHLELNHRAENFLLHRPWRAATAVASFQFAENSPELRGALFVKYDESGREPVLDLGIYLSKALRQTLDSLEGKKPELWDEKQQAAFAIATEEVSHFQYLLYHATGGRSVTQLELEIQGDVDKFLLLYFSRNQHEREVFEKTYEKIFENFSLPNRLSRRQKDRYIEANRFAKRCISKHKAELEQSDKIERALRSLRKFYRLGAAEKISELNP